MQEGRLLSWWRRGYFLIHPLCPPLLTRLTAGKGDNFGYTIHPLGPPPLGKEGEENRKITNTPLKLRDQVGWNLSPIPYVSVKEGEENRKITNTPLKLRDQVGCNPLPNPYVLGKEGEENRKITNILLTLRDQAGCNLPPSLIPSGKEGEENGIMLIPLRTAFGGGVLYLTP